MSELSPQQLERFIAGQLDSWEQARKSYDALSDVMTKSFDLGAMMLKVQYNPARIVSTAAKVDAGSIASRRCFLCNSNLPAQQKSIFWGDRYSVLVNPFPIFPRHITIADTNHTPQLISGRIAEMMRLALQLPGYTVFYNGANCGASAPDHMHFQAGNSDFLLLNNNIDHAEKSVVIEADHSILYAICGIALKAFVIEVSSPAEGENLFARLYAALPLPEGLEEPMLNLLCHTMPDGRLRLIVIPRKRHRPSFYGNDNGMLVSPASVDLGGVFITPVKKDFDRFDAAVAKAVYEEVCLEDKEILEISSNVI